MSVALAHCDPFGRVRVISTLWPLPFLPQLWASTSTWCWGLVLEAGSLRWRLFRGSQNLLKKCLLIPSYCIANFVSSNTLLFIFLKNRQFPLYCLSWICFNVILMALYSIIRVKISSCFRRPYFIVNISFIQQILLQQNLAMVRVLTLGMKSSGWLIWLPPEMADPVPSRMERFGNLHIRERDLMPQFRHTLVEEDLLLEYNHCTLKATPKYCPH